VRDVDQHVSCGARFGWFLPYPPETGLACCKVHDPRQLNTLEAEERRSLAGKKAVRTSLLLVYDLLIVRRVLACKHHRMHPDYGRGLSCSSIQL
jgi:hypothetical protein